jgi:hypothetical protein
MRSRQTQPAKPVSSRAMIKFPDQSMESMLQSSHGRNSDEAKNLSQTHVAVL